MDFSGLFTMSLLSFSVLALAATNTTANEVPKGPGHYKILTKKKGEIHIPFKMHNKKPLMALKINGKDAALMIDNGHLWDEVWLLGSPLVDSLGLVPKESVEIGGSGKDDPTQAYTAEGLTLQFADITFYEQSAIVSPAAAGYAKMFTGTDGQLCNTFFRHFIVEFDFYKSEIILHDPAKFKYNGQGSVLDMQLESNGSYSVPMSFTLEDGKHYDDRVDIDLGGIYSLQIATYNNQNIKAPVGAKPLKSYGAQGEVSEYQSRIKEMTIGKFTFNNPEVVFSEGKTARIHQDNLGVIGLPLFMKFNTVFDYFNNKLYLIPNNAIKVEL